MQQSNAEAKPQAAKRRAGKQHIIIVTGDAGKRPSKPSKRAEGKSQKGDGRKAHKGRPEKKKGALREKSTGRKPHGGSRPHRGTYFASERDPLAGFAHQPLKDSLLEVFEWLQDDRLPEHPSDDVLLHALEHGDIETVQATLERTLEQLGRKRQDHDGTVSRRKGYMELMLAIISKSSQGC